MNEGSPFFVQNQTKTGISLANCIIIQKRNRLRPVIGKKTRNLFLS